MDVGLDTLNRNYRLQVENGYEMGHYSFALLHGGLALNAF